MATVVLAEGDEPANTSKHLGVASCAASTCHGRVSPSENSAVALNEYFIWSKYDRHSQAYQILHNDWSRRIATNMGIKDAATATQCLTCHTDFVPPEQQGERFHMTDGIGCEACHGGAETWIDSHYGPNATAAENRENGLNPTEKPLFQARMCQSCHLGDEDRFVTHEMMAAGHPRLRFELDTWLVNMPPHHVEDEDYRVRKGAINGVDRWIAGLVSGSKDYLDTLLKHIGGDSLVPELALFDCHACHRPINTAVQRSAKDRSMMPAGTLRPNDHALHMLAIVLNLRDPQSASALDAANDDLHGAIAKSQSRFLASVRRLHDIVNRTSKLVTENPLSNLERAQLNTALLQAAANGDFRDYGDAEQLYLALQLLAEQQSLPQAANRYDRLFKLLDSEQSFNPRRVAAEAKRLLSKLKNRSNS